MGPSSFPGSAARSRPVLAFLRRDVMTARSYRGAYVLDLVAAFFGVSIYYFISRTFTGSRADLGAAPDYFAFALVGVVTTMLVQSAVVGAGRRLREEQLTGTLEALLAQPIGHGVLALGLATYPLAFAAARCASYLLVAGLLLGADFSNADWLGWVIVWLATAAAVLGIGLVVTAVILTLKRADAIVGLVTFGLALLGGAYFPVSVLPGWLEWAADLAPTRPAFDGARAALFAGGGWGDDVAALAACAAVGIPVGVWLFGRSLRAQRRRGSLAEY